MFINGQVEINVILKTVICIFKVPFYLNLVREYFLNVLYDNVIMVFGHEDKVPSSNIDNL